VVSCVGQIRKEVQNAESGKQGTSQQQVNNNASQRIPFVFQNAKTHARTFDYSKYNRSEF
jgi:hypothetical protein